MQSINNVQDLGIHQKLHFGNGKGYLVEVRVSKMGDSFIGTAPDKTVYNLEGVRTVDGAFQELEKILSAKKEKK